jgi:uncharacterized iron-regulated protein
MLWGQQIRTTSARLPGIPATDFLDRLASELKIGRHAAYRHAVQRTLETVRKKYESGEYRSTTEAELMLRKLVEAEDACK